VTAQVEQQQLAEGLQHGVAFGVAVALIDGCEVVDIQCQQRQRLLLLDALRQTVADLALEVFGAAQGGQFVEQAVFAKHPLALLHLLVNGLLLAMPVEQADGQQDHADGHGGRLHPVIPADVLGQADKFVEHIHPPGKKHKAQAVRQVVGDPAGGSAFNHQPQPEQHKQGGAAFAEDIQPMPLAEGFGGAECQVQQHRGIGRQQQ